MIGAIWAWLTDPTSWSGTGGIGARLVEHVRYTLIVIALAAAVAIPLGLFVGHTGRGRWLVTGANAARAVPTLGFLFGLSLWLGPRLHSDLAFSLPSIVVLVVLAIPPILAGAYAGVESVDPAARDAATGMGMGPGEVLRRVEIPIALPLLLSGLRAATMQVIATAIAAYVGGRAGVISRRLAAASTTSRPAAPSSCPVWRCSSTFSGPAPPAGSLAPVWSPPAR